MEAQIEVGGWFGLGMEIVMLEIKSIGAMVEDWSILLLLTISRYRWYCLVSLLKCCAMIAAVMNRKALTSIHNNNMMKLIRIEL